MKSLKYLVLALALGCSGNGSSGDRDVSNMPRPDMSSMYDSSSGRNNEKDSGRHPYDSGLEGRLDGGLSDAGNGMNRPPTLRMVYEESHPLAGESYTERNVRRMRDTPYIAEVSDPDGDDMGCRFEFSDGYERDWGSDCRVVHAIGSSGNYTLAARVRDSRELEGEPRTIGLRTMDNIPPVARIACVEVGDDGLCVYRLAQWEEHCWDGSPSYDEDGEIIRYRLEGDVDNPFPISSASPVICGGYTIIGEFDGRYSVQDDDNEWGVVDFRSIVE